MVHGGCCCYMQMCVHHGGAESKRLIETWSADLIRRSEEGLAPLVRLIVCLHNVRLCPTLHDSPIRSGVARLLLPLNLLRLR